MYGVQFTAAAYRLFKKLSKDVRNQIATQATSLKIDPLKGEQLHGKFRMLRSLHFSYKGVAYRVIYQVFSQTQTVIIRLADKRENIYKRLEEMS